MEAAVDATHMKNGWPYVWLSPSVHVCHESRKRSYEAVTFSVNYSENGDGDDVDKIVYGQGYALPRSSSATAYARETSKL